MFINVINRQAWLLLTLLLLPSPSSASDFDRLEGDILPEVIKSVSATSRPTLTLKELDALPPAFADTRASFFVVKTGQGNFTRILASQALRQSPGEPGAPVPILVLERFDTFEPGKAGARLARGVGVLLFDGFQIDLDNGQIVPPGQGGDLEFRKDPSGQSLHALGKSALITLSKPITIKAPLAGPSPGKAILPTDFNGRYKLYADGRPTGTLELEVAPDRQLTGRFRSDPNGTSYPITGEVSTDKPQFAHFKIKFPRTEQEFDAYLASQGKNQLAGTTTMLTRPTGFFALREGTRLDPTD